MAIFTKQEPDNTRGPTKPYKLDPEICFRLWQELGSLRRAADYLEDQGYVNPATGRAFRMSGVRVSAFAWMFEHPDEAYQCALDAGSHMTRHEFNQWLIWKRVARSSSTSNMYTWLQKHDLLDPDGSKGYRDIYERKFKRLHIGGIANLPQISGQVRALPSEPGHRPASPGAAQPSADED